MRLGEAHDPTQPEQQLAERTGTCPSELVVACYHAENQYERMTVWSVAKPQERWRAYRYDELITLDKANPDLFLRWDQWLEGSNYLPDLGVRAAEFVENPRAALEQFTTIEEEFGAE